MKAFCFVLASFVLAIGSARAEPVPVTIEQLLRSPNEYANKIVRITGQVDNCVSLTCNLCPVDMTDSTFDRDKCLGLEFEGFPDKKTGIGVSELMDKAFRFATVTLEAKFDPTCLAGCTDRASVLFDSKVVEVLSRKPAIDGIVSYYYLGKLSPASRDDERDMRAEFSAVQFSPTNEEIKFFVLNKPPGDDTDSKTGLACVCWENNCEGRWPSKLFGGLNSIGNPFHCFMLSKLAVGWRVLPDEEF